MENMLNRSGCSEFKRPWSNLQMPSSFSFLTKLLAQEQGFRYFWIAGVM